MILFGLGWGKSLRIWVGGFFFLAMDVFIIILMSYLYYFNQIAKKKRSIDVGCEEVK